MTYKESLIKSMDLLASDPKTVFIGYNTREGSKANGTLINVPEKQLIETPVAENLMVGLAIGMSLAGRKPVVYIERFDFILNAIDAIVNHLDKIKHMSKGEFEPKVIIRVVVGSRTKPLFTGLTHTQDFSEAMQKLVNFPVYRLATALSPLWWYAQAAKLETPAMVVEYRDMYDVEAVEPQEAEPEMLSEVIA